jgi:uncharacterized membrane protein
MMMDYVIAVSFEEDSKASEALTKLKHLDSQGEVDVQDAAVVVRDADGLIEIKEEIGGSGPSGTGTFTGGLIGLLVGVLSGPFGILIGGLAGVTVGAKYDLDESELSDSVLHDLAKALPVRRVGLLAQLGEVDPETVDLAMAAVGGTVTRRRLVDVEGELAAADEAQQAARKAASKQLNEQRRTQAKEQVDAKIAELKAKLHHGDAAPTSN